MASFYNNDMANNRGTNRKRRDHEEPFYNDIYYQPSFDNPQKRIRIDREIKNPPSKVLYVRNVPTEMDDSTISYLAVPFGFIDNIVFVRKNSQALIQMKDLCDAVRMVDFYSDCSPMLYGKQLYIQYSKHQQLDSKHDMRTVEQANEKREHYLHNWADNRNGASEILCILIDKAPNLIINHLVFYKIFSRFGRIMRIVSYTKKEQHFGLVEFEDPLPAHVAKLQLNNSRLLGDLGKMKIEFSKVPGPLLVERQSEKVRDYCKKPINKNDDHEMSSAHYDFPLFSENRPAQSSRGGRDRSSVSNLMSLPERRSMSNAYDDRLQQISSLSNQNGADLASAIRLMSYLNPSVRNRGYRN